MVRAQVFTVAKIFDGEIKDTDLSLQFEELAPLEDGGEYYFGTKIKIWILKS